MTNVRDAGDRLMGLVFGAKEAGACISPSPWEGCEWPYGYVCCHYNCVGDVVCYSCFNRYGFICP
jgi:hypothetical protein